MSHLPAHCMNDSREIVILDLPMLHPWSEVPHLSVVAVVREPHLRADVEDLPAVDDDSAVVDHILMHDRPGIRFIKRVSRSHLCTYMPMSHSIP